LSLLASGKPIKEWTWFKKVRKDNRMEKEDMISNV
jgi:hypothetical protein